MNKLRIKIGEKQHLHLYDHDSARYWVAVGLCAAFIFGLCTEMDGFI